MSYPLLDRELKQAYDVLVDAFLVPIAPNLDSGVPEGWIHAEFMVNVFSDNAAYWLAQSQKPGLSPARKAEYERRHALYLGWFKDLSPWVPFFRALYDRFNPTVTQ